MTGNLGFDITNYILHSPGISDLDPLSLDEITDPGRYANERLAQVSIGVIAISIALSRYAVWLNLLNQ